MDKLLSRFDISSIVMPDDRCGSRSNFYIRAYLRESGCKPFVVTVINLSISGFACEAQSQIKPGKLCWLTLPGLAPLQAEVIWNDGFIIGSAFTKLLSRAVHDRFSAQFPENRINGD